VLPVVVRGLARERRGLSFARPAAGATRPTAAAQQTRRADLRQVPPLLWIDRAGQMAALAIRVLTELLTPGLSWRREAIVQVANVFWLAIMPVLLINFLVGFAGAGVSGGAALEAFGAVDRVGAFVPVALLREGGPIISGAVMAGTIGTTITAELGARVIREEIEALRVMGIDPIRNLVLPRIVALTTVMLVLNMLGLVAGVLGAYAGAVGLLGGTSGSFIHQALANTSYVDLWASEVKTMIFGFMIGIIACHKGLKVSGGAEGVGRAVNESVVACLVGVGAVGLLFTTLFLAIYPDSLVLR
jgi:phospholipid/cholesterol/gamma-HCH transport system permease protein